MALRAESAGSRSCKSGRSNMSERVSIFAITDVSVSSYLAYGPASPDPLELLCVASIVKTWASFRDPCEFVNGSEYLYTSFVISTFIRMPLFGPMEFAISSNYKISAYAIKGYAYKSWLIDKKTPSMQE